jgi:hypothetical protein
MGGTFRTGLFIALLTTSAGAGPTPPPPAPAPQPAPPGAALQAPVCSGQATFVVEPARTGGDGTAARPFGSFAEALSAGRKACSVTIEAGAGDYRESITLRGSRVKLKAHGPVRPVLRGSIDYAGGGWLEVEGLDVVGANPVAIKQVGGRLTLINVRVLDTGLDPRNADSGLGLWVSGGGQAIVLLSVFERNAHSAIRVEGAGTKAWLTGVVVRASGIHPLARAQAPANSADIGALLVTRQASAWANAVTVEDSAVAGVNVSQRARLRLERSNVRRTTSQGGVGGFAVNARDGATLDWVTTVVSDADVCGISVNGAAATVTGGSVTRAAVGACVKDLAMSLECLKKAQYREVGVPLQAERYELPSLSTDAGPPPVCPRVDAEPQPNW